MLRFLDTQYVQNFNVFAKFKKDFFVYHKINEVL